MSSKSKNIWGHILKFVITVATAVLSSLGVSAMN